MRALIRFVSSGVLSFAAFLTTVPSAAQAYPERPVRLVVPYPPGGSTDSVARTLAERLATIWGRAVVVENHAGAGGIIGTELVARATADGHTLLMGAAQTHALNPHLYARLPYDPFRDFAPVSLVATTPLVLVIHPGVDVSSVQGLIALARQRPGALSFASTSSGGTPHLAGELLASMAGINIVHVPYRGSAPAITDLLAGHVQLMFDSTVSALPHVKAGRLRALAVTTKARSAAAPDLPTVAEAALPGFEVVSWLGIFAPAKTPAAVVERLNRDIAQSLTLPDVRSRLIVQGAEPAPMSTGEFTAFHRAEWDRWRKIITDARVRPIE